MSFGGGGTAQYRIDYIIRLTQEGSGATGLNQVNTATKQLGGTMQQTSASAEKMRAAHERVTQAGLGVTKAAKGMTFGIIGMTTAGAEFVGMLSMWQATQDGVKEAQAAVNEALKEGGKNSSEYKNAVMDLAKANRWAQMTFRNLLLSTFDLVPFFVMSINGFMKLRTAMKMAAEAKAAENALKAVGGAGSAVAAGTNVASAATTKFTAASNAAAVSTIASTGAFKNQSVALGTATAATNAQTAASSKLRTILTGLGKGFGILAIAIAAGAVAAIAYKNNIGGLRTTFDQIGVSIGNAVPQLKGFLNTLKDLALAFPNFGKMWDIITGKKDEPFKAMELSEEQLKKWDEAKKGIDEFRDSASGLFREIAEADKGGRKDFFEQLGITTGKTKFDDAKEGAKDFFNELENGIGELDDIEMQFKALDLFDKLDEFINVDPDTVKKIRFSMEDSLRDVFEGGGDIFDKLADVVEQNATASQPEFNAAVAQFAADNPGIVELLEAMDKPDMAKYFQDLITDVDMQARQAFKDNLTLDESPEAQEWKDKWWDAQFAGEDVTSKAEQAGAELVKGLITGFENVDWSGIKTMLRIQIMDPLVIALETIGQNIVPIIKTAITNNINKDITTEGEGGKVTGIDWNGLWNKILETGKTAGGNDTEGGLGVGKATWWKTQIEPRIDKLIADITSVQGWNTYLTGKATLFAEIPKLVYAHLDNAFATYVPDKTKAGTGGVNFGQGEWFKNYVDPFIQSIQKGYAWFISQITTNETVIAIRRWFHDPIGALMQLIKDIGTIAAATKAAETTEMKVYTAKQFLIDSGIQGWLDKLPTIEQIKSEIMAIPGVKTLLTIKDAATKGFDALVNAIKSLGGNIAFADTGGGGKPTGLGGKSNPTGGANWLAGIFPEKMSVTVPEIIVNGKIYTSGPIPPIIPLPPGATNSTPTIQPQSAIIAPKTYTIQLPGGNSGGPGDIPGQPPSATGPMDPFGGKWPQLRISVPMVTVVPQQIAYDTTGSGSALSEESLFKLALGFKVAAEGINQIWNQTMQAMSSITNTTVQAVIQVWIAMASGIKTLSEDAASVTQEVFNQALENVAGIMNNFASHWSSVANSVINNGEAAADGITEAMQDAMDEIISAADDMLGEWSSVMDDMVSAAEDAAEDIESALAGIPDEEVKINYVETGSKPPGRAHGVDTFVHKPTLFLAGEQGSERVTVTRAHSKPDSDGEGGSSGGTTIFNGTVNLKIAGTDIINETKLKRKFMLTANDRDRFG